MHASLFSDFDIGLCKAGQHFRQYEKLGAHPMVKDGVKGTYFSVWAPNAETLSVIGDFNGWNKESHSLSVRWDSSGIWEGFIPNVGKGTLYKFFIRSRFNGYQVEKKDPFAFYNEKAPGTASIVWDLEYEWNDASWMKQRKRKNALDAPLSFYEIHLGSWRRKVEENNRHLTYRELAQELVAYIKEMGYTHVEFMPIMDHPFYGSWGYQTIGYYAPTARYGSPQDLMHLIDCLHQNDIGVVLDWVPSHFPSDECGLVYFDGTHLYEHGDPQKGIHPDWDCCVFNNGRNEVKEFLISSALFWLDKYHVDGLRVDAVASMLYLDYSREDGGWSPNIYGGRENLESINLIRELNSTVYQYYPDVQMVAEESTAWGNVSRPTSVGGLGFGMKWNMGWMHDTLLYFQKDAIYRQYHQNDLTFSMLYAYTESFLLSLSHDEVVYGKGSLISKMPADDWQKFANLRLLYGYMYAHPGKKLLFMGSEFAQWSEWHHESSLDWGLLQYDRHQAIQKLMKDINALYRKEPALYKKDFTPDGFEWVDASDWQKSLVSFIRKTDDPEDTLLVVCNFTPTPWQHYKIGVPAGGYWQEILNTDAAVYGGSGMGNMGGVDASAEGVHGREYSVSITIPPLAVIYFKPKSSSALMKKTKRPKKDR
jgi:1,4-alpha-glucan branching enzyme